MVLNRAGILAKNLLILLGCEVSGAMDALDGQGQECSCLEEISYTFLLHFI